MTKLILLDRISKPWLEAAASIAFEFKRSHQSVEVVYIGKWAILSKFDTGALFFLNNFLNELELRGIGFTRLERVKSPSTTEPESQMPGGVITSEFSTVFGSQTLRGVWFELARRSQLSRLKSFKRNLQSTLKHCQPELIVVPNGRFALSRVSKSVAEEMCIPVKFYETGFGRYILQDEPIHNIKSFKMECERISTQVSEDELQAFSIEWQKMASRSRFSARFRQGLGSDSEPPKFVFFTSSSDEFLDVGADWSGHGNQYQRFQEMSTLFGQRSCALRVHPNLLTKSFRHIFHEAADIAKTLDRLPATKVFLPDSKASSYELVSEANLIGASVSTLIPEARLRGKPVVITGPSYFSWIDGVYRWESRLFSDLASIVEKGFDIPPGRATLSAVYASRHRGSPRISLEKSSLKETFLKTVQLGLFSHPTLLNLVHSARMLVNRLPIVKSLALRLFIALHFAPLYLVKNRARTLSSK